MVLKSHLVVDMSAVQVPYYNDIVDGVSYCGEVNVYTGSK